MPRFIRSRPFVLIVYVTVLCGPRKRGDSTLLNIRVFGWEAANRIFITFLLFAQQVVSAASSIRYPAFSNLYSFTRIPGIWVTIASQVPWLEVSWHTHTFKLRTRTGPMGDHFNDNNKVFPSIVTEDSSPDILGNTARVDSSNSAWHVKKARDNQEIKNARVYYCASSKYCATS